MGLLKNLFTLGCGQKSPKNDKNQAKIPIK